MARRARRGFRRRRGLRQLLTVSGAATTTKAGTVYLNAPDYLQDKAVRLHSFKVTAATVTPCTMWLQIINQASQSPDTVSPPITVGTVPKTVVIRPSTAIRFDSGSTSLCALVADGACHFSFQMRFIFRQQLSYTPSVHLNSPDVVAFSHVNADEIPLAGNSEAATGVADLGAVAPSGDFHRRIRSSHSPPRDHTIICCPIHPQDGH